MTKMNRFAGSVAVAATVAAALAGPASAASHESAQHGTRTEHHTGAHAGSHVKGDRLEKARMRVTKESRQTDRKLAKMEKDQHLLRLQVTYRDALLTSVTADRVALAELDVEAQDAATVEEVRGVEEQVQAFRPASYHVAVSVLARADRMGDDLAYAQVALASVPDAVLALAQAEVALDAVVAEATAVTAQTPTREVAHLGADLGSVRADLDAVLDQYPPDIEG